MIASEILEGIEYKSLQQVFDELYCLPPHQLTDLRDFLFELADKELAKHPLEFHRMHFDQIMKQIELGDVSRAFRFLRVLQEQFNKEEPIMLLSAGFADMFSNKVTELSLFCVTKGILHAKTGDLMIADGIPIRGDPNDEPPNLDMYGDKSVTMFISDVAHWLKSLEI